MELTEINQELFNISKRLDKASKNLYKLAKDKAESEFEYRKALMQEIVKLRDEGLPATLIADIARGKVADLKFKRDLAQDIFKSALSSLDAIKSQQTSLQSILKYQDNV